MAGPTPPPPGWDPPPPWGPPPLGGPPPPWTPPATWAQGTEPPTEPFAIVSIIASLAVFFCFVGPIVGIVFGHLARSRIKQNGKGGRGLALAGLIISYAEIVVIPAVIIVIAVALSHTHGDARPAARELANRIALIASEQNATPRDGDVIRLAVREEFADVRVGDTGTAADDATDAELASAGWRLEIHDGFRGEACLAIPPLASDVMPVAAGSCPSVFSSS